MVGCFGTAKQVSEISSFRFRVTANSLRRGIRLRLTRSPTFGLGSNRGQPSREPAARSQEAEPLNPEPLGSSLYLIWQNLKASYNFY